MTSPPDLLEIRQRRAAITPPPWEVTTTTDDQWFVHSPKLDAEIVVHDGDHTLDFAGTERTSEFIAHAPADIDWLVGEVTDRRQEVAELRGEVEQLRGESRRLRDDIALLDAHNQESFGMADELDTAHEQVEQLLETDAEVRAILEGVLLIGTMGDDMRRSLEFALERLRNPFAIRSTSREEQQ